MPKPKRNVHAVAQETLTPPDALSPSQRIARVLSAAGNSLYQLELSTNESLLAELPARFRNTIWIKRGSYVLVDTVALADRENKLGGEIVNIVRDEKTWRKMPYWPGEFAARQATSHADDDDDSDDEDDQGPKMPESESDED